MTPEVLSQLLADLGLDRHSSRALLALPLVEVAWADGRIQKKERRTILRLADETLNFGEEDARLLTDWLRYRPSTSYFERGRDALRAAIQHRMFGFSNDVIPTVTEGMTAVAKSSGGFFGWFGSISPAEASTVERVGKLLATPFPPPEVTQDDTNRWNARVTVMYDPSMDEDDEDEDSDFGPQLGGVLVYETSVTRTKVPVDDKGVVIGSAPEAGLTIKGAAVGPKHCTVYQLRRRFYVKDHDSRTGTFVNGERVGDRRLIGGETLKVGDREVTFKMGQIG